jgi:peptidoglycan/LPS O-acetylase OafA/YrhL
MSQSIADPSDSSSPKVKSIQGLRGIAVLLVVFGHLNFPFFRNGFIGVDVFFVISGFLITKIMVKEYVSNRKATRRQGWISFLGFYSRRVRRILPASYFVILIVLLFSALFSSTLTLKSENLINEGTWAALFLSNLFYADQATQYFGEATQQSPFLHFWSLAVEEQFYLFWPVFFLMITSTKGFKLAGIVFNWRNRLRLAMISVSVLSFSVYVFLLLQESSAGYFSSIARFWEFSVGALFALGIRVKRSNSSPKLFYLTFLLLFVAFATLSTNALRAASIIYVIATGFFLHSATNSLLPNFALKIFENRVLGFFGKISFSLYLLHWPMIVLLGNLGFEATFFLTPLLFLFMTLLSWVMFKEVEERFLRIKIPVVSKRSAARRTRYFPLNYDALKYSTAIIFVFILFVNIESGNGRPLATTLFQSKVIEPWSSPVITQTPSDSDQESVNPALGLSENSVYSEWTAKIVKGLQTRSLPDGIQPGIDQLDNERLSRWQACLTIVRDNPLCNRGPENAPRKVYIVGDSYALSIAPMVFDAFSDSNFQVVSRNRGQCMVPEVEMLSNGNIDSQCADHRVSVNDEIAKVQPYLVIAMSLNSNSISGDKKDLEAGMIKQYRFLVNNADHVVVLGETPFTVDPRTCLQSNKTLSNCVGDGRSRTDFRALTELSATKVGANYLDLTPWICNGIKCPVVIDNSFVTWDGGHLTTSLSRKLSPLFRESLRKMGILEEK